MNKLKDTSAEWVKINLKLLKAFLIPKMVALWFRCFCSTFGSPFIRTSDYGSGLAFMATLFTQELIMLRQLERLFLLNILVWLIGSQSSTIGLGEHVGIKVADNLWALYGHMSRGE